MSIKIPLYVAVARGKRKKPGNEDEKKISFQSFSACCHLRVFVSGIAPFSIVRSCETNCCRIFKVKFILLVYAIF